MRSPRPSGRLFAFGARLLPSALNFGISLSIVLLSLPQQQRARLLLLVVAFPTLLELGFERSVSRSIVANRGRMLPLERSASFRLFVFLCSSAIATVVVPAAPVFIGFLCFIAQLSRLVVIAPPHRIWAHVVQLRHTLGVGALAYLVATALHRYSNAATVLALCVAAAVLLSRHSPLAFPTLAELRVRASWFVPFAIGGLGVAYVDAVTANVVGLDPARFPIDPLVYARLLSLSNLVSTLSYFVVLSEDPLSRLIRRSTGLSTILCGAGFVAAGALYAAGMPIAALACTLWIKLNTAIFTGFFYKEVARPMSVLTVGLFVLYLGALVAVKAAGLDLIDPTLCYLYVALVETLCLGLFARHAAAFRSELARA